MKRWWHYTENFPYYLCRQYNTTIGVPAQWRNRWSGYKIACVDLPCKGCDREQGVGSYLWYREYRIWHFWRSMSFNTSSSSVLTVFCCSADMWDYVHVFPNSVITTNQSCFHCVLLPNQRQICWLKHNFAVFGTIQLSVCIFQTWLSLLMQG